MLVRPGPDRGAVLPGRSGADCLARLACRVGGGDERRQLRAEHGRVRGAQVDLELGRPRLRVPSPGVQRTTALLPRAARRKQCVERMWQPVQVHLAGEQARVPELAPRTAAQETP